VKHRPCPSGRNIHPCPRCEGEALTLTKTVQQSIVLEALKGTPPTWDYSAHESADNHTSIHAVTCDECTHVFTFDLGAYQDAICPYTHDSTPNGCHEDCLACAWYAEQP
jgi:hypothetical protein